MLGTLGGCTEPSEQPRRGPRRAASDKAALYGDAALLPTREGERARAEVAVAEELRQSLEALHEVERAQVTVSMHGGRPRTAAVVVRARAGTDTDALRARGERLAHGVLGPDPVPLEFEVSAPSQGPDAPPDPTSPLLLLAVLGLGISLGLTFDRAVAVARRRRRR